MRKLPIILTLVLIAAWGYTSWYWYTCNIKWFCDSNTSYSTSITRESNETSIESSDTTKKITPREEIEVVEEIDSRDEVNSPKLSVDDVLFDPLPKEVEQEETNDNEGQASSQTWSLVANPNNEELEDKTATICEAPLTWAISLWGENNSSEVEKLEAFLISRWEDINIDGTYGEDDLEAVKRFQQEYKEDVLDPWGITTPTGYVWRTSIAKINELACK